MEGEREAGSSGSANKGAPPFCIKLVMALCSRTNLPNLPHASARACVCLCLWPSLVEGRARNLGAGASALLPPLPACFHKDRLHNQHASMCLASLPAFNKHLTISGLGYHEVAVLQRTAKPSPVKR